MLNCKKYVLRKSPNHSDGSVKDKLFPVSDDIDYYLLLPRLRNRDMHNDFLAASDKQMSCIKKESNS